MIEHFRPYIAQNRQSYQFFIRIDRTKATKACAIPIFSLIVTTEKLPLPQIFKHNKYHENIYRPTTSAGSQRRPGHTQCRLELEECQQPFHAAVLRHRRASANRASYGYLPAEAQPHVLHPSLHESQLHLQLLLLPLLLTYI